MTEPTVDSKRSPMNPGDDSSWHNILFPSCSSWISPEPLPPSSTPTGEATLVCRCLLSHSPIGQPVAAATSTSSPMTTPELNITMPSLTTFHGKWKQILRWDKVETSIFWIWIREFVGAKDNFLSYFFFSDFLGGRSWRGAVIVSRLPVWYLRTRTTTRDTSYRIASHRIDYNDPDDVHTFQYFIFINNQ